MSYVPGSIEVKVGEIVYTTGQDGIYPPGLKLGEVVEVRLRFGDRVAQDFYSTERESLRDAGSRRSFIRTADAPGIRKIFAECGEE